MTRVAVVTGASTGIGRSIAVAFAADGYMVVINSIRDSEGGRQTVLNISQSGGEATYCQADVSTLAGAATVVSFACNVYGPPSVLINNAGATRGSRFGEWTVEHWHDMLDTNLLSAALMSQEFVTKLPENETGAIINIASIRGLLHAPRVGIAAYCAAKAGVLSLTNALARSLAPQVTVNAISPGFVDTSYMTRVAPEQKQAWLAAMPINRLIDPEEVGRLAVFLADQPAITGANIVMDGAYTIVPE